MYYYCNKCKTIHFIDRDYMSPSDGCSNITDDCIIDEDIAPVLLMLYNKGYRSLYSCSGHVNCELSMSDPNYCNISSIYSPYITFEPMYLGPTKDFIVCRNDGLVKNCIDLTKIKMEIPKAFGTIFESIDDKHSNSVFDMAFTNFRKGHTYRLSFIIDGMYYKWTATLYFDIVRVIHSLPGLVSNNFPIPVDEIFVSPSVSISPNDIHHNHSPLRYKEDICFILDRWYDTIKNLKPLTDKSFIKWMSDCEIVEVVNSYHCDNLVGLVPAEE